MCPHDVIFQNNSYNLSHNLGDNSPAQARRHKRVLTMIYQNTNNMPQKNNGSDRGRRYQRFNAKPRMDATSTSTTVGNSTPSACKGATWKVAMAGTLVGSISEIQKNYKGDHRRQTTGLIHNQGPLEVKLNLENLSKLFFLEKIRARD